VRVSDKRRVLVVDDDPVRRLAIDRQLDLLGWEGYGAATGDEALRMLERGPRFEAMFIDAHVSDVSLRELAGAAARRAPHLLIRFTARRGDRVPPLAPLLSMPLSIEALARTLRAQPPWQRRPGTPAGYPR
jgi:CheY-like chemotaxis protein